MGDNNEQTRMPVPVYLPTSNGDNEVIGHYTIQDRKMVIEFPDAQFTETLLDILQQPWMVGIQLMFLEAGQQDVKLHIDKG